MYVFPVFLNISKLACIMVSIYLVFLRVFSFGCELVVSLIVRSSAIDCLKILLSELSYSVSDVMLYSGHLLSSLILCLNFCVSECRFLIELYMRMLCVFLHVFNLRPMCLFYVLHFCGVFTPLF